MAFSNITADPAWGTLSSGQPVLQKVSNPPVRPLFDGLFFENADLGAVVNLGAVNTSAMVKPFAGWITYTSSGGGGSTRPASGMLYPRGQG